MPMSHDEKMRMAEADLASNHRDVIAEGEHFKRHPELYRAFERATLDLIGKGYRQFSQWMVANYVRYNVMTEARVLVPGSNEDPFKVPNGFIAIWARHFIVAYPEHAEVFRIRALEK